MRQYISNESEGLLKEARRIGQAITDDIVKSFDKEFSHPNRSFISFHRTNWLRILAEGLVTSINTNSIIHNESCLKTLLNKNDYEVTRVISKEFTLDTTTLVSKATGRELCSFVVDHIKNHMSYTYPFGFKLQFSLSGNLAFDLSLGACNSDG